MIYSFHMPLFVFVSGYFYATKCKIPLKDIVIKQFKRLLVPQFAFCILGIIVLGFAGDRYDFLIFDENSRLSIKNIYHFLTSAWFVWCIFFCSIIINFFVLYTKGKIKSAIILALTMLLVAFFYRNSLPGPFFLNEQVVRQLPFFILGILYRTHFVVIKNGINANRNFFLLGLGIINIAFLTHYKLFNEYYWYSFLWMVNSTGLIYLLLSGLYEFLKVRCKIFCRFFVKLGTRSLGIYLIHIFMMKLLKPYLIQIYCYDPICTMVAIFFISLLVVFFCYILSEGLHRSKILSSVFLGE